MDHSHHSNHHDHHMPANSSQPPSSPPSHDDHGASGGHHTMSFHGGYSEVILFEQWKVNSLSGLFVSMLAIFLLTIVYEGLKYYREHLFWKQKMLERTIQPNAAVKQHHPIFSGSHAYQTFLHFIQITLSFMLMLIFMTYNIWLCLALALGSATGYFIFCWKKSIFIDITENCH